MALSLRISPEIWRLTLLSGLAGLTTPLVGCASKSEDGFNSQTNSASGSGNNGSQSTGGQTGNGTTGNQGGSQTGTTTTHTGGATSMGGAAVGGAGPGQGGVVNTGGANTMDCEGALGIPFEARCIQAAMLEQPSPLNTEQCSNGLVHRFAAEQCPSELPRADLGFAPPPADAGIAGECDEDTDCVEHPHGYCSYGYDLPSGYCDYGCVTDSECGDGMVCDCRSPVGVCVPAECTTDADCACDATCMRVAWNDGCGTNVQYRCQTPEDECRADLDCANGMQPMLCEIVEPNLHTTCQQGPNCVIGRPFIVLGVERRAELIETSNWLAAGAVLEQSTLVDLSASDINQLAHYWQYVGMMEHASIAAFARFALELMGQGAPAELIEATQRAMADETQHAKLAFALASRYLGKNVGPGKLDLSGAGPSASLSEMVHTAILEGAVGETVASMEAAEALARATDPAVRTALTQIVEDEANHARLAWAFLQWALQQQPSLRAQMQQTFAALFSGSKSSASERSASEDEVDAALSEHGLLSPTLHQEVRARALAEVIQPCAAMLLGAAAELRRAA